MNTNIPEYEPPNGAKRDEIEALYPSIAPPAGEERMTEDVFPDTGTTVQDFKKSSRAIAEALKGVGE